MILKIKYQKIKDVLDFIEPLKADTNNIKLKKTVISLKRHKITTILQISSFVIGLFNPMVMLIIGFISLSIWYIPMPKIGKNK